MGAPKPIDPSGGQVLGTAAEDDITRWRAERTTWLRCGDSARAVNAQDDAFRDSLKVWLHGVLPLVPGDAGTRLQRASRRL